MDEKETDWRGVAIMMGASQLVLGSLGWVGIILYGATPKENSSAGQYLQLPVWTFLIAVPTIILSAIAYAHVGAELEVKEKAIFFIGLAWPIIAVLVSMFARRF